MKAKDGRTENDGTVYPDAADDAALGLEIRKSFLLKRLLFKWRTSSWTTLSIMMRACVMHVMRVSTTF